MTDISFTKRYTAPIGNAKDQTATVEVTEGPNGNNYYIEIANLGMDTEEWKDIKATMTALLRRAGYKAKGK